MREDGRCGSDPFSAPSHHLPLEEKTMISLASAFHAVRRLALALAFVATAASTLQAQSSAIVRLTPSDPAEFSQFGQYVACDGETLVASYYKNAYDAGVYVFARSDAGWTQIARLTDPDPGAPNPTPMNPVAVQGDLIVAGRSIFTRNAGVWSLNTRLPAGGFSVAISGTTIAFGSPGENLARVYTRSSSGWTGQTLTSSSVSSGSSGFNTAFGVSVALSPDILAVGAPGDHTSQGAVVVFELDRTTGQWVERTKLVASDGGSSDSFGQRVALEQSLGSADLIVGAPSSRSAGDRMGAAYAFRANSASTPTGLTWNWSQTQKLRSYYATSGGGYGNSVSIKSGLAIVSGTGDFGSPGQLYSRANGAWYHDAYFPKYDTGPILGGAYAVAGAPFENTGAGTRAGAVYVQFVGSPLAQIYTPRGVDVGAVGAAGSTSGGTIQGSGADIWNRADAFHYFHELWTGDGELVVNVKSMTNSSPFAKVGVMFRESLAPGARNVFAFITPDHGSGLQRRLTAGGDSEWQPGLSGLPPTFLKLRRNAGTFTAFQSDDGVNWTQIGSYPDTLPADGFAGVAITSHQDGVLCTANFTYSHGSTPPPPAGWQSTDVGAPGAAGSDNISGSTATVSGAGEDIWGTADEFHFAYQQWNGDGEFIARLTGMTNTHAWAKAGIMFRETLDAGSRYAMAYATPNNYGALQMRTATNGNSDFVVGPLQVSPMWVKLTRTGNVFAAYQSADGTNWTFIASTTVNAAAAGYVGLAVTSHVDGTLCTATFDNVQIGAGAPPPPPPPPPAPAAPTNLTASATSSSTISLSWTDNSNNETQFAIERSTNGFSFAPIAYVGANTTTYGDFALAASTTYYYRVRANNGSTSSDYTNTASATTSGSSPPPPSWFHDDIGSVGTHGDYNLASDGTISVRGSGADIWDTADGFQFFYRAWSGDGTILLRVDSVQNTHLWAKAGVMFRDSLAANAANAFVYLTPSNGVGFQTRAASGGTTSFTAGPWWVAPPYWVKLVRSGGTVSAYSSADGIAWDLIGSQSVTLGTNIYVGLAVTAHNNAALNTSTFSQLDVH
jgi:regulation of enolase protein 1 (concanavalin A-like superfamily)